MLLRDKKVDPTITFHCGNNENTRQILLRLRSTLHYFKDIQSKLSNSFLYHFRSQKECQRGKLCRNKVKKVLNKICAMKKYLLK